MMKIFSRHKDIAQKIRIWVQTDEGEAIMIKTSEEIIDQEVYERVEDILKKRKERKKERKEEIDQEIERLKLEKQMYEPTD
jgi:formylmethanofuran dehydrogenase subunit E